MKLPRNSLLKRIHIDYRFLGFLIPFLSVLVMMAIRQTEPFGDKYSMLYSDCYHQYYPFFFAFRQSLLNGESLLHTWKLGMGMDYLGLIAYYLASPLNLLSVLLPNEGLVLEYFSMLMPIKLGFAGLFFSIFLSKVFQKNDISIAMFGTFYALCAWALGYQWNIMWLDTFALLPLVILGMISLLRERKFILYTVSLFLSVFSNYYIGFFTCIFVLLSFICYEICCCKSFKRLLSDLAFMALFSGLAIGMTAILTLPAYGALQDTQSTVNKFPEKLELNMTDLDTWAGFWEAMREAAGNMNGAVESSFKEGPPNIYCGVGTIFLAFVYLTCRQIKIREKLCSVFLLFFFLCSFIIRYLDYIWHGFHFPNMIYYRFSFLFSFVLLVMAFRAYNLRFRIRLWQLIVAAIPSIGLIFCYEKWKDPVYLLYNVVLLLLYIAVCVFFVIRPKMPESRRRKDKLAYIQNRNFRRNLVGFVFAGIMVIELVLNLVNFSTAFPSTGVSDYPMDTDYSASVIRYMKQREDDNLFFRSEVTRSQTLNDSALNDYNGISAFTSSANVNVTKFMKALGYGAKDTYNRYRFEESSPISNLFLNLKYMIDRDGYVPANSYFDERNHFGDVYLLENNAYLPLGFLAESQLVNVDFSNVSNPLMFQNELLQAASGIQENAWTLLNGKKVTISASESITLNTATKNGYCSYKSQGKGTIDFTYTVDRDGFMCLSLHIYPSNKFNIYVNGVCQETHGSEGTYGRAYSLPLTVAVGNVHAGDIVEIKFKSAKEESGSIRVYAGILDEAVFRSAYNKLAESTLELTSFSNTYVEGTIDCNRNGVLYTSIPQNGNWTATVDGKPAQTILIGEAMVGLLLPEGKHTVSFAYKNPDFSLGWKVSLFCLLAFCGLSVYFYQPFVSRKKGKYEK